VLTEPEMLSESKGVYGTRREGQNASEGKDPRLPGVFLFNIQYSWINQPL